MQRRVDHVCQKDHAETVDPLVNQLPPRQANPFRHVCAGCSYELGISHGKTQATEEAKIVVNHLKRAVANAESYIKRTAEDPGEVFCVECGHVHIEGTHFCPTEKQLNLVNFV